MRGPVLEIKVDGDWGMTPKGDLWVHMHVPTQENHPHFYKVSLGREVTLFFQSWFKPEGRGLRLHQTSDIIKRMETFFKIFWMRKQQAYCNELLLGQTKVDQEAAGEKVQGDRRLGSWLLQTPASVTTPPWWALLFNKAFLPYGCSVIICHSNRVGEGRGRI